MLDGVTPLCIAAAIGKLELVEAGADLNQDTYEYS
jgi:hypothetical protein